MALKGPVVEELGEEGGMALVKEAAAPLVEERVVEAEVTEADTVATRVEE